MSTTSEKEQEPARTVSSRLKTWREIPIGGLILEPGNATSYETGSWRTSRPVWDGEACASCLRCWVVCPEGAVQTEDGKVTGIDYAHCKGCGICASVCPEKVGAIRMEKEAA